MTKELLGNIIEGIREKKGKDIVNIDISSIDNSICDNFIICSGNSNTQVSAIAESIQKKVKENLNETACHKEGLNNALWVLLDYTDIIVHIFQADTRSFYNLEDLWADAAIEKIETIY